MGVEPCWLDGVICVCVPARVYWCVLVFVHVRAARQKECGENVLGGAVLDGHIILSVDAGMYVYRFVVCRL